MQTMFRVSSFLLTTGILIGSFVGFWYGPWSPNLDHRARNLIVQDQLQEGVDLFLWKAEYALSKEAKHEALWNAARTANQDLRRCRDLPMLSPECNGHHMDPG